MPDKSPYRIRVVEWAGIVVVLVSHLVAITVIFATLRDDVRHQNTTLERHADLMNRTAVTLEEVNKSLSALEARMTINERHLERLESEFYTGSAKP